MVMTGGDDSQWEQLTSLYTLMLVLYLGVGIFILNPWASDDVLINFNLCNFYGFICFQTFS